MDSFELNKIAGALLAALLVVTSVRIVAGAVYTPAVPHVQPQEIAAPTPATSVPEVSLQDLLASASAERGARVAKKCVSCHSLKKGGPNKVGPHLWGVVGRQVASVEGFSYSSAMRAYGGTWTEEALFAFLASPRKDIPGTAMSFVGLRKPQQRADVIAYLHRQSD